MGRCILVDECNENNYDWKIIGACSQGLRHIDENIVCQDKIYSLRSNNVSAIALADGAGSALYSHVGAEIAARALCEKFCADFDEIINAKSIINAKKIIMDSVLEDLKKRNELMPYGLYNMASTLLGVACDSENFLVVHIGDGIIACFKEGKTLLISSPYNGEFANETLFTTSKYALQKMKLARAKLENIGGFAIMSDGADNSFYNHSEKKFTGLLYEIYRDCVTYSESENNLDLQDLMDNVVRHNTYDDCALILMCRRLV